MFWVSEWLHRDRSNRYPQHMILWRTDGNYEQKLLLSGRLKSFHGYGDADVHVMPYQSHFKKNPVPVLLTVNKASIDRMYLVARQLTS